MKLRDTNRQVYEKNYFTYLLSCILPSFSKKASPLLLPKRLWNCVSKISFRKYKQKVVNFIKQLFYDISDLTSFVLIKKYLGKTCYTIKPFRNSKIKKNYAKRMLKKRIKKFRNYLSLRYWSLRQQILFFSWIWYLSPKVTPVFVPESFENTSYVRGSHWSCSLKIGILKYFANFRGKHLCWILFLIESSGSPTHVSACGICEIFKNAYFEENL